MLRKRREPAADRDSAGVEVRAPAEDLAREPAAVRDRDQEAVSAEDQEAVSAEDQAKKGTRHPFAYGRRSAGDRSSISKDRVPTGADKTADHY